MKNEFALDVSMTPEDYSIEEIVSVLAFTSDQYYNGEDGESFLTDGQWDNLYRFLQVVDPINKYLIGVGADVRGDKVELPYQMPGLDQVHEDETKKWIASNRLDHEVFIVMHKMDGNSGQIIYDTDGNIQSAFSRGSSTEGQDLTRHFKLMKNLPTTKVGVDMDGSMAIRVEVEMKDEVFEKLNAQGLLRSRSGKPAKNARNYVAGQLNSSKAEQVFYDNVDVIAYEIMFPLMNSRNEELVALNAYGFDAVEYLLIEGMDINDGALIKYLEDAHKSSPWAIDGFVLAPNKRSVRDSIPARKGSSLNPVHSKKFKVGQEDNVAIAEVVAIHRKVSKDGYIKPRVEITPVDLVGVTVTFATAFNELFLKKHNIGVGAKIKITRSGDVIPYIVEVVEGKDYKLPDTNEFGEYEWSAPNSDGEQVDLILTDVGNSSAAQLQQLISFFTNLGVEFISKKGLEKLFDAGYREPSDIITAEISDIQSVVGEANGRKGMKSLYEKLNPVEPWMLAGVTKYFGRSIGRRKLKKVYDATGDIVAPVDDLVKIEGIEAKTAEKIVAGYDGYADFLIRIKGKFTFAEPQEMPAGGVWEGQIVTFTGFRDKDAEAKIEAQGGRIGSSVSSKTTLVVTKDPTSSSSKIMKAKDLGIEVIGPDELYSRIN